MAFLQNAVIKKQLAEKAKDSSYEKYKKKVEAAIREDYSNVEIISELEFEMKRIEAATHENESNDPIFKQGVENAKASCLNAIQTIISELKEKNK
jgi:hypothetical protein